MTFDPHLLSSYHYHLPEELIAQHPCNPRERSRLLIVDRVSENFSEIVFAELIDFLQKGDSLVFNDTKVIPARLLGKRKTGGEVEIFLTIQRPNGDWEVLARPGKKLPQGTVVIFSDTFSCEILEILDDGRRLVRFNYEGDFEQVLAQHGEIPLPHYIKREKQQAEDANRYQTVFAANPGAVAAPTAGLHFSREMLDTLAANGVHQNKVTLHVGLGTFRPVQTEDIRDHKMHHERIVISPETAQALNSRSTNHRQICVGTTCCRTLESAASPEGVVKAGSFETNIFIYPGYQFKYVQHLLTNFHLPGSSLLMLVSAFAGPELIKEAYLKAVKERFRFFSYGDAMLIV